MQQQMPKMNPMPLNPGMMGGMNPAMMSGMNPGMMGGMNPAMMGGMNPGMMSGMNPAMMSGMNPGMMGGMNPAMMSGMNPGMMGGMNPAMMGGMSPMGGGNNNPSMAGGMNQMNKTITRLKKEYQLCENDSELKQIGCTFGFVEPNNLFKWKVSMIGPRGTPYENGVFTIIIIFPQNYPQFGAEFRFTNKIYHLNVDWREKDKDGNPGNGHICLSTLNEWKSTGKVLGKPGFCVKQALFDIFCLFYNQGIESPYDDFIAAQYKNNKDEFNRIAKEWTKKYA